MNDTRRKFLATATGIAAAASACSSLNSAPAAGTENATRSRGGTSENFSCTVSVYDSSTQALITEVADVHLEPRQSNQTSADGQTVNGIATLTVTTPGYYDIEVTCDGYHDGSDLQEYFNQDQNQDIYIDPL